MATPLPLRGFAIDSETLPPPPTNRSATCVWASPGPAIAGHGLPGRPSSRAVWPPLLLCAINHPPDNDPTARQANRIRLQHGRREEEHIVCGGTISVGSIAVQKNWLDPTTRVGSPRFRAAPRHSKAGSPLSSIPEIRRVGNTGRTMIFDLECNGMQLTRLYGFDYPGRVVDTRILSRLMFNPLSEEADEYGKHALFSPGANGWAAPRAIGRTSSGGIRRWRPTAQDCQVTAGNTLGNSGPNQGSNAPDQESINPSQSKGLR